MSIYLEKYMALVTPVKAARVGMVVYKNSCCLLLVPRHPEFKCLERAVFGDLTTGYFYDPKLRHFSTDQIGVQDFSFQSH